MNADDVDEPSMIGSKENDQKSDSASDTGSETPKGLELSGRWSDLEVPADFGEADYNEAFEGRHYTPPSVSPSFSPSYSPSPKTVSPVEAFEDPKYDAPVLFIKRTFGLNLETLSLAVMKAFEESEVKDVKIVSLYINSGESRDHAYLVLNSEPASKLLLDGTLAVVIQKDRGEGQLEEISLWIDYADLLAATSEQDPYMLYVWQLPKDRPVEQVEHELVKRILELSPIKEIEILGDARGMCQGWAEITFKYERDTQKCVYMLNYNRFMNVEIRAAFYQLNRPPRKPIVAPVPRKSPPALRAQNPRKSPNHLSGSSSSSRSTERGRRSQPIERPSKPTRQRSMPEAPKAPARGGKPARISDEKRSFVKPMEKPAANRPEEKKGADKKVDSKKVDGKKGEEKKMGKNFGWEVIGREGRTK